MIGGPEEKIPLQFINYRLDALLLQYLDLFGETTLLGKSAISGHPAPNDRVMNLLGEKQQNGYSETDGFGRNQVHRNGNHSQRSDDPQIGDGGPLLQEMRSEEDTSQLHS